MLISHICDPELSKKIYAFTENANQDLLIFLDKENYMLGECIRIEPKNKIQ